MSTEEAKDKMKNNQLLKEVSLYFLIKKLGENSTQTLEDLKESGMSDPLTFLKVSLEDISDLNNQDLEEVEKHVSLHNGEIDDWSRALAQSQKTIREEEQAIENSQRKISQEKENSDIYQLSLEKAKKSIQELDIQQKISLKVSLEKALESLSNFQIDTESDVNHGAGIIIVAEGEQTPAHVEEGQFATHYAQ